MRSKSKTSLISYIEKDMAQTKTSITLCFTSQLDLLVKPTPVSCLFLRGRVITQHLPEQKNQLKPTPKQFTLVTRQPYSPGRAKELCFTTLSLAMETMGMRLSVVKLFWFPGAIWLPCDKGELGDYFSHLKISWECHETKSYLFNASFTATSPWVCS